MALSSSSSSPQFFPSFDYDFALESCASFVFIRRIDLRACSLFVDISKNDQGARRLCSLCLGTVAEAFACGIVCFSSGV